MQPITSGEKLFNWILKKYQYSNSREDSWIARISYDFDMPDFESILFKSTALMLTRRFINNAAWYIKRFPGDRLAVIDRFEKEYLRGSLGLEIEDRRILQKLIFDAQKASESKISESTSNKMYEAALRTKQRCKLCGNPIDFTLMRTHWEAFSLDHIWPKSLGGESEEWNLQVSHQSCNTGRINIANESDVHYEHFNVKSISTDDKNESFWSEFNNQFRLAALMKAEFRCEVCNESESIDRMDGTYHFSLKNRNENYNLFNVQITCDKHNRFIET